MRTWHECPVVSGRDLRYVLTWHLVEAGSVLPVRDLVRAVEADGFAIPGQPNKPVSDALRWEIGWGRVVRVGRGRYRAGQMPRQTKSRIGHRVRALRHDRFAATRDSPPHASPAEGAEGHPGVGAASNDA